MKKIFLLGIFLTSPFLIAQVGIQTQAPVRELHIAKTNANNSLNNIRIDGLNQTNNLAHKPANTQENLYVDKDGVLVINSENYIIEKFKKTATNTAPFPRTLISLTSGAIPEIKTTLYTKTFVNNIDGLLMYTFQPSVDFTVNIFNTVALGNLDMFDFQSTRNVGFEIIIEKETTPGVFTPVYKKRKSNPHVAKTPDIQDLSTNIYDAGILKAVTNLSDMVPLNSGNYRITISGYAYRSFDDDPTQQQSRNPYDVEFVMEEHSEMNFFLIKP